MWQVLFDVLGGGAAEIALHKVLGEMKENLIINNKVMNFISLLCFSVLSSVKGVGTLLPAALPIWNSIANRD